MDRGDGLILTQTGVVTEDGVIENGYIRVEGGKIVSYGEMADSVANQSGNVIPLHPNCRVLPGMIDIHIHGADGADTMDATFKSMERIAKVLPREGTTSFLATTITQSPEALNRTLSVVSEWIGEGPVSGGAECLGIHLEGPFLSPRRAGAQPLEHIRPPSTDQFRRWQTLCNGHIRLVTLAPEEPGGLELIRYLKNTGVVASIGHSDATYAQVVEAVQAGATHVTHLYNGMRGFHHREPGVVGAAWLRKELLVEVIADGVHSTDDSLRLAYNQIGSERMILITDAMRAKCLQEGVYDLGGQRVTVKGREARLADGTLAGSILRLADGVNRMRRVAGCGWEDLIRMTAANPARALGVDDRKGTIAVGKDADLVVWGPEGEITLTLCRGQITYRKGRGNGCA
ncbi:N-acetylglucosamine-6-phosphate deacetylase [Desmospora profundinema]|uniref:N-acetylglucosamine-6-phosphate deacetylase n=1 Tax=Desmospora profundinema TaxID=1571184 RepID=A0ABU1IH56_9BACL|nr:N-acetylglucosamine-6-phosphate deacetylase [Desmospora profundinema]MDR6224116.1 N-acetylglucosamine-6-phosphate deacetylase [Desmospora profundinema]